jgi:hypothetical protein
MMVKVAWQSHPGDRTAQLMYLLLLLLISKDLVPLAGLLQGLTALF